jgi:hypothetical protein
MDGIYYQKTLGAGGGRRSPSYPSPTNYNRAPTSTVGPAQVIQSADASSIIDSSSAELVKELQERLRTPAWHLWSMAVGAVVFLVGASQQLTLLAVLGGIIFVVGGVVGYVVYTNKRTTEIKYDLDPHYGQMFSRMLAGFEQLRKSHRLWMVETTSAVHNGKYHAGAASILTRKDITARLGSPSFLHLNIRLPILQAGKQSLYFLPDVVLVVQGNHVGAVSYSHLNIGCNSTQFIEDGSVPRDSEQVGTTWRYVNKSGGPDRRFSNNRQLPILRYAELKLQSTTGLNEAIQVSNVRSADAFVQGLRTMLQSPRRP